MAGGGSQLYWLCPSVAGSWGFQVLTVEAVWEAVSKGIFGKVIVTAVSQPL